MSIAGLIAALILTSVVVIVIALPLIARRADQEEDAETQKQRERIAVYYERVLRNLNDLDEDHALGKLDDDDYARERALWLARGAAALRALDDMPMGASPNREPDRVTLDTPSVETPLDFDDAAVEAAINAYRQKREQA
jgi:cytochrome c-type biogenesis protein CcmI